MELLKDIIHSISNGEYDACLLRMYCTTKDGLSFYRQRLLNLVDTFGRTFGYDREVELFSASGRTEICGNHTDH